MPEDGKYTAIYTFDGKYWVVQFRSPDISTFGRNLQAAKAHARSLLAVYLEIDVGQADPLIEDTVRLPRGVRADIEKVSRLRGEAETLRADVAAETRRATAELRRAGLSTRDVGELLGISSARVAQIERESAAA